MAFHGVLNMLCNRNSDIISTVGRGMKDVWGGVIAATGQNLLMAMVTALLFYFCFCCEKKKLKVVGLISVALSIVGTFTNGSRTLLYIVTISFGCMTAYYCIKAKSVTQKMKIVMTILLVVCVGVLALATNFMGVSDWINSSGLFMRYAGNMTHMMTQTGRSNLSEYVIEHFWEYPLGKMPTSNYAHNLWLDIDIEVGWIPMLMHILFCIAAVVNIIKYGIGKRDSLDGQILVLSLFIAMLLEFFVEPILMGNPYFYMCFCFITGGIVAQNRNAI